MSPAPTMRAQVNVGFGDASKLRAMDRPRPVPGPGDVLVRTVAAGVNHVDWQIREGWFTANARFRFPFVPGWDVCGTVVEVGPAAARFAVGDLVFAYCRDESDLAADGAYAEYVRVAAASCAPAPRGVQPEHLAVLPLVCLTAAQIVAAARVGPTETVVVLGSSGAVGRQVVADLTGRGVAVVAGVRRNRNVGAPLAVVDTEALLQPGCIRPVPAVDVVIDCGVGVGANDAAALLRPGGRFLTIVRPPDAAQASHAGITATHVFGRPDGAALAAIAARVAAGSVPLPADIEVLDLADAATAQERLRAGSASRFSLRVG